MRYSAYLQLITEEYAKNKAIGPKDYARYNGEERRVNGEFAKAGFTGNRLSLDGALVLKRDVDKEASYNAYNTGRATMAVTFGSDYYFNAQDEFAILGKLATDDADDDDKTSYDRMKELLEEYGAKDGENSYYYYTKGGDFGHYFMKDTDGKYFAKDENGDYGEAIEDDANVEDDAEELFLEELAENSAYLNLLPYNDAVIKIVKITFAK